MKFFKLLLISLFMFPLNIYAADLVVSVIFKDEHKARLFEAYLSVYPKEDGETNQDYAKRVLSLQIKKFLKDYEDNRDMLLIDNNVDGTVEPED